MLDAAFFLELWHVQYQTPQCSGMIHEAEQMWHWGCQVGSYFHQCFTKYTDNASFIISRGNPYKYKYIAA